MANHDECTCLGKKVIHGVVSGGGGIEVHGEGEVGEVVVRSGGDAWGQQRWWYNYSDGECKDVSLLK